MVIVGLTGGIGSGKTTVLRMFNDLGVAYYIADVEAKHLMNESPIIKEELIALFGKKAYKKGVLSRSYIADIVFTDKEKLAKLNAIVHPQVRIHFQDFLKTEKGDYVIYENAILFESKADQFCDHIITVTAPINERIYRVMQRDKISRKKIEQRINNQLSDKDKVEKSQYVIINIELEQTKAQVINIHKDILNSLKKC